MKLNIWHLVTFLIGYMLGKDHVDLSAVFIGMIGGLIVLWILGWAFRLLISSTNIAGKLLQLPWIKKVSTGISYLIGFIFTHWMLIFISLILAMPITFLVDAIMSSVDTAQTLIIFTVILFPVVEIIYHIQFRKKKRQIFGFDI